MINFYNWVSEKGTNICISNNPTPNVIERGNFSVDESQSSKRNRCKLSVMTFIVKSDYTQNQKMLHETRVSHDRSYISSINQSKSLSNDVKFLTLASRKGKDDTNLTK